MKLLFTFTICIFSFTFLTAQELTKDTFLAFKADNVSSLKSHISDKDLNACFEVNEAQYTLLSISIKMGASKCFEYLLNQETIELNKTCGGKTAAQYTAKYGKLEMLKQLKKAGANLSNTINDKSVLDYAKKYKQEEIITYLSDN